MQPLCRARARFTPRLSPDSCMLQQEKGARAEAPPGGLAGEHSEGRGEEQVVGLVRQALGVWSHRY